jgi:hypothetical protein
LKINIKIRNVLCNIHTAFLIALLTAACFVTPVFAAQDVIVSVNSPAEVDAGEHFEVIIEISEVVELNGAEYILVFDPEIIRFENVGAGQVGSKSMSVLGTQDVAPGQVKVLQSLGLGSASGEGSLAEVHFTALKTGSSIIDFSAADRVLSGMGEEIQPVWTGGIITVVSTDEGAGEDEDPDEPSSPSETNEETQSGTENGDETPPQETGDGEPAYNDPPGGSEPDIDNGEEMVLSQDTLPDDEGSNNNTQNEDEDAGSVSQQENLEKGVKWPVLGGIIGGVAVIVTLVIIGQLRRYRY